MHELILLSNPTVDVLVDVSCGVPTIVHWGAPLGGRSGDAADLGATARALQRPRANGTLDAIAPISIVPEHGSGFHGRPGLLGRRGGGVAWSPRFTPVTISERAHVPGTNARSGTIVAVAEDSVAGLRLTTTIRLDEALHVEVQLTNIGPRRYSLDGLTVTVPLPEHAGELQRFDGRWAREFQVQRVAWPGGAVLAENRRGRTSHEHLPLLYAGEVGFGEWHGEVWGAHLAWSGNHTHARRTTRRRPALPAGRRTVAPGRGGAGGR